MSPKINIKRIYEKPAITDGYRILVDRLWPRGITKEIAKIDLWEKDIAPSAALRRWFSHDPLLWMDFKIKYLAELRKNKSLPEMLKLAESRGKVTLVYAARDIDHNHAIILKSHLEKLLIRMHEPLKKQESVVENKEEMLSPLTVEYDSLLIFSKNIRRGFSLSVDPKRMKKYADWFFFHNLQSHFEMEEDFIFSLLDNNDPVVIKSRAYQRKIKRLFADQNDINKSLSLLEELLETFVRYERNILMPLFIQNVDAKRLSLIMNIYAESILQEDWGDRFWEQEK